MQTHNAPTRQVQWFGGWESHARLYSCGEERNDATLFAGTLLCARKVPPYLEGESANMLTEHYIWRAIERAKRITEQDR